MTKNEKIAKWLKIAIYKSFKNGQEKLYIENNNEIWDPLNNCNQQKWIMDELHKKGYNIDMFYDIDDAYVIITKALENINKIGISFESENKIPDLDKAFINAVIQLIDKENEKENENKLV